MASILQVEQIKGPTSGASANKITVDSDQTLAIDGTIGGTASIPAARLSGTLPAIDGSSLTGITAGIQNANMWRLASDFESQNGGTINTWEEADTDAAGKIGSGITHSSGAFTFPQTGIYLISTYATGMMVTTNSYLGLEIQATANNGTNWDSAAVAYHYPHGAGGYNFVNIVVNHLFDVTSTSQDKIKFRVLENGGSGKFLGSSSQHQTAVYFIRLGDT